MGNACFEYRLRRRLQLPYLADYITVALKCQPKIAADDTLLFYFYLSKEIRLGVSCESSEISSLIFSEKVFMSVACCSRDWRYKS